MHNGSALFSGQIATWLWFTVLFANFAEAVAEGRGKAQAEALRRTRSDTQAKRYVDTRNLGDIIQRVNAQDLRLGDIVLVEAGDIVPGDGEIIEGVASVNESAITGESAPVIREAGGDRSAVTGGTMVLSDHVKVRITAAPGSTFIDRMIALVEGAERQKTPNEMALSILLSGLTIIFLIVCVTLWPLARYSGADLSATVLIALLVCLIPTTIGGLLSAIGIAGMDRLIRFNVIATSGPAVEAAGDVDTLLLDKTGTVTFGNRMADEFIPTAGVSEQALANAVLLASLSDETPEERSIVALAKSRYGVDTPAADPTAKVVPFTAQTRVSGLDLPGRVLRKGAVDAILALAGMARDNAPTDFRQAVDRISRSGGTPLAVSDNGRLLGVVHLKDIADIVLVDITSEELIQRLQEGKVYLPETARLARRNFFTPGNLTALRALTIRWSIICAGARSKGRGRLRNDCWCASVQICSPSRLCASPAASPPDSTRVGSLSPRSKPAGTRTIRRRRSALIRPYVWWSASAVRPSD